MQDKGCHSSWAKVWEHRAGVTPSVTWAGLTAAKTTSSGQRGDSVHQGDFQDRHTAWAALSLGPPLPGDEKRTLPLRMTEEMPRGEAQAGHLPATHKAFGAIPSTREREDRKMEPQGTEEKPRGPRTAATPAWGLA